MGEERSLKPKPQCRRSDRIRKSKRADGSSPHPTKMLMGKAFPTNIFTYILAGWISKFS